MGQWVYGMGWSTPRIERFCVRTFVVNVLATRDLHEPTH
jgi:hypothetical protein